MLPSDKNAFILLIYIAFGFFSIRSFILMPSRFSVFAPISISIVILITRTVVVNTLRMETQTKIPS